MNYLKHGCILGVVFLTNFGWGKVQVENLRCEYLANPLGLDAANPRLSWILTSSGSARSTNKLWLAQ